MFKSQGFTLIELILVISLISIIAASSTPFLSNFILRINLDTTHDKLISSLNKARQYSVDGKDGQIWGVCIQEQSIRLYSSSCTTPTFSEEFSFASSISISGFSDVSFSSDRGEPTLAQTITISSDIESDQIHINNLGTIQ